MADPPAKKLKQATLYNFARKEPSELSVQVEPVEKVTEVTRSEQSTTNQTLRRPLMKSDDETTQPFQPIVYDFPKKKYGTQKRSFQASWFKGFPWLHYVVSNDSVLCHICVKQDQKMNLTAARNKEQTFISEGFSNWKRAIERFQGHQISECHKLAVDFEVKIPSSHGNVLEIFNETNKINMQNNRRCLVKILESLQYLGRQGLARQGKTDEESNFMQLLRLRAKDDRQFSQWLDIKGDTYTSHDIQNEISTIMAHQVIRSILEPIRAERFFTILCDEYTDVSNKEQLCLCFRWVDDKLFAHEDFLGYYHIPNISAETIVTVIKDALLRLQLPLSDCRGQCYDGASNMFGKNSGVAKRICDIEPKALATHCHGHVLSLSVKDATLNCKTLSDTMDTVKEITQLIKFSPKRQNLLGQIKDNLVEEDGATAHGVLMLCPTRWTVRSGCFQRVLDNYSALLQEWTICLEGHLQPDIKGRIIGCEAQMKSFNLFFGLHFGERIYCHTDNLSKTLQKTNMSAVSGQRLAHMTRTVLQGMRNVEAFDKFYDVVLLKKSKYSEISEPTPPRRRRAPSRFEVGTGNPTYPETAKDFFRRIYFEVLDGIIAAIQERFNQASFQAYLKLESLLINALKSEDYSDSLKYLMENYSDDVDVQALKAELPIFGILLSGCEVDCFEDILRKVQQMPKTDTAMISQVVTICKLIHVNPSTNAVSERSFSSARRLKTWLRSTLTQKNFNSLAILNIHKHQTDRLDLLEVAKEFVSRNESRVRRFGKFSASDFQK